MSCSDRQSLDGGAVGGDGEVGAAGPMATAQAVSQDGLPMVDGHHLLPKRVALLLAGLEAALEGNSNS